MRYRVFKTRGFATSARKAHIGDAELVMAMGDVIRGQGSDLGGGVWKKRLNENRHRSIVLARGRGYWIFQFLFAKSDQGNISQQELRAFKALAKAYEGLDSQQIQQLLDMREFVEIAYEQDI
ncbi:type II toxin-antitoxin system RelE/ParE family toxin [Pseudomonas gingeri]|uniref:Type II toxin-antitoxin system RelE/ParE family toxin n=1 Tax=Pseudomonas gingeri TaxID=117681 RepID=A0A7Y8CNG5_9PSED|nr:type II toxin-antitoxin system RelE/ParE family toxin [Pseudomonas gingeri]NWB31193.1 type II toxin-antitoxin system RelE/ParE family toxin [Pseudomonas gingeri]NWC36019.1 type II toxin-antitoxin system RelE/ParE family toxin [Pseudomonas gingeri]NWD49825.1 type II toxin-antitoxin system RelE/ParE family toxin [Pseudomonas gingeri]